MLTKIWTFIRHNRGIAVSIVIALASVLYAYGCQSKVTSILFAPNLVNRGELRIEVDTFIAQAELKFADLDSQDEFKNTLFNTAIDFAQGGKLNPLGVAVVLGNILGAGAVVDNIRKRTVISTLKSKVTNPKEKEIV